MVVEEWLGFLEQRIWNEARQWRVEFMVFPNSSLYFFVLPPERKVLPGSDFVEF